MCPNLSRFLHFFNHWSLLILFSKFSLYIVQLIDVTQRTSRNCRNCSKTVGRELVGLMTCGNVCSQGSATFVIDVRERFFSVAFRPCSFWKMFSDSFWTRHERARHNPATEHWNSSRFASVNLLHLPCLIRGSIRFLQRRVLVVITQEFVINDAQTERDHSVNASTKTVWARPS